uniref:Olfactory receptor n=1 Tax=Loxodonta africana TaxID=9785 RepID=G3U4N6_LOXAF
MKKLNKTNILEFILVGFSDDLAQQPVLFSLLLFIYLTTMIGNLLIILTIVSNAHFHSLMYFFLSNLSLIDLCLSSTIVPKMFADIQTGNPTISFNGCLIQMYMFLCFSGLETLLLSIMSYDRFVAICLPMYYLAIMTPKFCALLVVSSWIFAIFRAQIHTILLVQLSFCEDNKIPQFFCDIGALLKLSCSDTYINELLIFIEGGLVVVVSFICILVSYILIGYAIVRIPSATGKCKTFSTYSSHISVVLLFFGTIIGVYLCPSTTRTAERDKAAAVMYTVVIPLLNPFIYSLRNGNLRGAIRKTIQRKLFL